jgi:hypothetical protein
MIAMVSGLAFRERLEQLPTEFRATLTAEPENPYNPCAIAVVGPSGKIGYVAPEVARALYGKVKAGELTACRVRQGLFSSSTGILGILEI